MKKHQCSLCFSIFGINKEPRYAIFQFLNTGKDTIPERPTLKFCDECYDRIKDLTDQWNRDAQDISCVFCNEETSNGYRISAEILRQNDSEGYVSLMPVYDLCVSCTENFDTYLKNERADILEYTNTPLSPRL